MGHNPVNAQQVNVDVREVTVKFEEDNWWSLPTRQGIYNLLAYRNGRDTAIATGALTGFRK